MALGFLQTRIGVSRAISTICAYFRQRAIVVTDVYMKGNTHLISHWASVHELGPRYSSNIFIPERALMMFCAAFRISRIAQRSHATVLNPHGFGSLFCACLAKLLSNKGLSVSWQIYDEDEDVSRGSVLTLLSRFMVRLGLVDQVLVLSNKMKTIVERRLGFSKVQVLRLGLSAELLELSRRIESVPVKVPERLLGHLRPHDESRIKLYFHGILVRRRRIEDLLRAMVILRDRFGPEKLTLYLAGSLDRDPEYVQQLRSLIKSLGLGEIVTFLGSLDDDEAIAFMYSYCDVFVFPCDHQSWGLAPLEAMLFGKPVVVSSGAAVSEVLEPERLALIVLPKNSNALAASIARIITNDDLRENLGRRGHDFVVKNLTYVSTGRQLERLWNLR